MSTPTYDYSGERERRLVAQLGALAVPDTGLRNISALIVGGSGTLLIRRYGKVVTLHALAITAGPANTGVRNLLVAGGISGFNPPVPIRQVAATFAGLTRFIEVRASGEMVAFDSQATLDALTFSLSWVTNDVFPVVLPGNPS